MVKGLRLTLTTWVDRLLSPPATIVRKAKGAFPKYVEIDALAVELSKRGHMVIVTMTQIVVLKGAHMVMAA